jgi:hypothetical protein
LQQSDFGYTKSTGVARANPRRAVLRRNSNPTLPKEQFVRTFGFLLAMAIALVSIVAPSRSNAQVYVSFSAPPPLQMDVQPQLSSPNSIWTPGYWAQGPSGYYWVSGSWTQPPQSGYLWTPGYWGYSQNQYSFNQGYWGPQVGYYGGINYGNGYYGNGYNGGSWLGNIFRYNTAISHVNPYVIRNVYVNKTVIVRNINRTSYNGGRGGVRMHPDANQLAYARQRHVEATQEQRQRMVEASRDRNNFSSVNHEKPMQGTAEMHAQPVTHAQSATKSSAQQHGMSGRQPPQAGKPAGQPSKGAYAAKPAHKSAPNAKATHKPLT